MVENNLINDWLSILNNEFKKPYFLNLQSFLLEEYKTNVVYPGVNDIFNALHYTAFQDVKVVILGQDPYHGPGQAHGLSFSVKPGISFPPSLRNIFKELQSDLGYSIPSSGYLKNWADQGVLLLNTTLTVRAGEAGSHTKKGWESFTDSIISSLNHKSNPVVFLLWGKPAQEKKKLIDTDKHFIIEAPHPSPLSAYRGFFGSQPFTKINEILRKTGQAEINWQLE